MANPGLPVHQGHKGRIHHAFTQRWCHDRHDGLQRLSIERSAGTLVCHGGERHKQKVNRGVGLALLFFRDCFLSSRR